jgi:hypothetical protein
MTRTREQDRLYQRDRRREKAAESHESSAPDRDDGWVSATQRVRDELDSLPASKVMGASVAAALAMAAVLDDSAAVPQHPAAAGQLRQVMAEIRSARAPTKQSALSVVRGGRAG